MLASCYSAAGRNEEAVATLRRSIAALDEEQQPMSVGVSYQELGIVQCHENRLSEAQESFAASRRAFAIQFGEDSHATAGVLGREGQCFRDLDRLAEALGRFDAGLKLANEHPDESIYVFSRYLNLEGMANTLADLERHDEAVVRFQELLVLLEPLVGKDDPQLEEILMPLAQSLRKIGEPEKADRAEARAEALRVSPEGG